MSVYVLSIHHLSVCTFFFFNDTATTEIYTLSLHDALPICSFNDLLQRWADLEELQREHIRLLLTLFGSPDNDIARSEEHTSELQSRLHLVCRLLLEKKKTKINGAH